ncbi:flavin-containing monooxygenase [Catenuloplanes atrovinosus]|uniref:Thioredoxin reductase n=1 Tax=Catenuloplanes atrovinosus TaxID=137266 RepID=A0AAE4C932_9ACTN|nr:NAD(P)-binding domain-containing protein [Catenuloplanes atrovinosus]MDR7276146.1 thioredoxin reductase [Catenuloplanes atrovinosus]
MTDYSVCVIGAGLSGIAVCRALDRAGVPFVCVEREDEVGGMWGQAGTGRRGPGYASLHLNTSKRLTGYSDTPMPADHPTHPSHAQFTEYLRGYAKEHGLLDHVETGTTVDSVRRDAGGRWTVVTRDSGGTPATRTFSHVVVASGLHQDPRVPSGHEGFTGEVLHTIDYHDSARFAGRRVLVVGFGSSAVDVAGDLTRVAATTLLSVRRGMHVTPKRLYGVPIDEIADEPWYAELGLDGARAFIQRTLWTIHGNLTDYGLPEPDHELFSAGLTISDTILSQISHGLITPKPAIAGFDGPRVTFTDGTSHDVDAVIYCTGYAPRFPFLPGHGPRDATGRMRLYQRIVAVDSPGLMFAGIVRPVGAITRIVELQSRWIAGVVTGEVRLPSASTMRREIAAYLAGIAGQYGADPYSTVHVDFAAYAASLRPDRVS